MSTLFEKIMEDVDWTKTVSLTKQKRFIYLLESSIEKDAGCPIFFCYFLH